MKKRPTLWKAFEDGAKFKLAGTDKIVTMRSGDAGTLALPSGRIVASDPLLDPWQAPFTTSVPPGSYPVHLAFGDADVALIMVMFKEGQPVFWKRAKPRYVSVDSATACLMDYKVARYLRRKAEAGDYERLIKRFEDALAETGLYGTTSIGAISDATIAVFRTWGGDGMFPAFFGYNASDELVCLVIDMLVEPADAEPV